MVMVIVSLCWVAWRSQGAASGRRPPPLARSGRLKRLFALLPVAGAELVGLQRVEDAQHLLWIAADAEVVHRGEADDALGIDDEGRPERYALVLVEDAERGRELALDVGEPREGDLAEILAALAPRDMDELAVDRQTEKLRVAVAEVAVEGVEADDLGRADEGEVLRPGENDQPLAVISRVICCTESS